MKNMKAGSQSNRPFLTHPLLLSTETQESEENRHFHRKNFSAICFQFWRLLGRLKQSKKMEKEETKKKRKREKLKKKREENKQKKFKR